MIAGYRRKIRVSRIMKGKALLFPFWSVETLSEQRDEICDRLDAISEFSFGECIVEFIHPQAFSFRIEQLLQELRLARYLISKLKVIWRAAILSVKKAVYERRFFILHETHPPEQTAALSGLFVGAFQTA